MTVKIALIRGDGIGHDVINAALAVMEKALLHVGQPMPILDEIHAGAGYYAAEGIDIEPDGEVRAGCHLFRRYWLAVHSASGWHGNIAAFALA